MNLNPAQFGEQLDMFRPAREIVEDGQTGDFENTGDFDVDEGWQEKLHEARTENRGAGAKGNLVESIKAEGIKQPVAMRIRNGEAHLANGHHRVATAYSLDRNYLVPVLHYDYDAGDRIKDWDDNLDPNRPPGRQPTESQVLRNFLQSPVHSLPATRTSSEEKRMWGAVHERP